MVSHRTLAAGLLLLTIISGVSLAQSGISRGPKLEYRDTTCAPCRDFYRYANGGWIQHTQLADGEDSRGTLDEMNDRAQNVLHGILDSLASAGPPRGSTEWKIGRFYASCMDSARADREGSAPARADLARIDAIANLVDLRREIARLQRMRVGLPFSFSPPSRTRRIQRR
jgi:Predicted metalloendopeptidase